jgi:hypothetical protein
MRRRREVHQGPNGGGLKGLETDEEKLALVSRHFGESHWHSGLGSRKLGRRSYEARVSRGLRIVFIREPDRLTAYDLIDHHQVAQWLKARKGD